MNRLKIKSKIIISFIFVFLFSLIISIIVLIESNHIKKIANDIYVKNLIPISVLGNISINYANMNTLLYKAILEDDNQKTKSIVQEIEMISEEINEDLEEIFVVIKDIYEDDEYKKILNISNMSRDNRINILELIEQDKKQEALGIMNKEGNEIMDKVTNSINEFYTKEVEISQISHKKVELELRKIGEALIIILFLGMIITIFIILKISSYIDRNMSILIKWSEKISKGDMDVDLEINSNDEFKELADNLTVMGLSISEKAKAIDEISKGNTDFKIEMKSKSDVLSKNINLMSYKIKNIVLQTRRVSEKILNGVLDEKIDTKDLQGDWMLMANGINEIIESLKEPLDYSSRYISEISNGNMNIEIKKEYKGELSKITNSLVEIKDSTNILKEEIQDVILNSVNGNLDYRGDSRRLKGEFKNIIDGINSTLDAIIKPVKEGALVLGNISEGNLKTSYKGEYKGDHAIIKNSLNKTIDFLNSYLGEITDVLLEMSKGNLDIEIKKIYIGDFVEIKDSLNTIIYSFNHILKNIQLLSEEVALGSENVSESSKYISKNSTDQASTIEEITASISDITSQTKQNASYATAANELSKDIREISSMGRQKMSQMLFAMDELNASSISIKEIIKLIDEIAFQTNILSLNAAVEAARAGENGKGFAVVADEVRNLAKNSANAVKDTEKLIDLSLSKVVGGMKIAKETSDILEEILKNIENASGLVEKIADASSNQATEISQIDIAINQFSESIQENTKIAEQNYEFSRNLYSQSEKLNQLVEKFKLKKEI